MCVSTNQIEAARPPWTASQLHGSPEPPSPYRIAPAFPGIRFSRPTSIEEIPGANRILVTEIGGKLLTFAKDPDVTQTDLLANLAEMTGGTATLFHATFHPEFLKNRFMFVCYVHPGGGGHSRVARFTLTEDALPKIVPGSERVIITWPTGGHNGGCLKFGSDGYLYISTGDGAGPSPPDKNTVGQDVTNLLGAVLRIDVDRQVGDKNYVVPPDNPFIELEGARPEVWAYGLRNPWKFGVDSETDNIFVADNGYETWESIHRIQRGGNCGWPIMEGRAMLRTEVKRGPTSIIPPVKDHPHTEANSVIGGPVYRGSALPDLDGTFVYGDYITGTIWGLKLEDDSYSHRTLVDTDLRITSFTVSSAGELYVLDYDFTGQVYELLPSELEDTSADFPRHLSDTGLFASVETLQPAPGVVPYDVSVNRYVDGADSQRWVAIPGDGKIAFAKDDSAPARYPNGTVFVKHLSLPQPGRDPIPLETQVLHFENELWQPYSYEWDDAGRDATLVNSTGSQRTLSVSDSDGSVGERTWHVSALNECRLCHNAASGHVLGFTLNQLDQPLDSIGKGSLMDTLVAEGVLSSAFPVEDEDQLVDPHDVSQNLDDRARSYLHANCSMCHHPRGVATVSFYLRRDLQFDELNTDKGTGIGTFGMENARVIVPGDPYRSVLMYRMTKLGYSHMPYIGTKTIDSSGVALVERWIRSLRSEPSSDSSPPIVRGSEEAEALKVLRAKEADRSRRDAAIASLVQSTEGALALSSMLHSGTLQGRDFDSAVETGYNTSSGDIRGLFEHFLPEAQRRPTLGSNFQPQVVLSRSGDSERGKLIFFSDSGRCRTCHDVSDQAKSTGPTLAEISKKYPRESELLQHIMQPSLKIDEKFATYHVESDDGLVTTGLKISESSEEVVLKTGEGKIVRIPMGTIEEVQKSSTSLMPDLILSDLTAQEAADLLEFIRSPDL